MPIQIPGGVTVEKTGDLIVVSGPKGKLEFSVPAGISVEIEGQTLTVKRKNDLKKNMALHGLVRAQIANMILGVSEGWSKNLELVGVGFRAAGGGGNLTLNIGFSHPVSVTAPEGISFEVRDNTKITVSGINKYLVGQVAANIKKIRPPDVYKGKGVRYEGEYIRRKPGKAGKVGAGVGGAK